MVLSKNNIDTRTATAYEAGVNSPFVILANNPNDIEGSLILSQRQGTLLSYTEDLNPENSTYEMVLELIDPDGFFLSKVFSFHHQHIKEFYRKVNGNSFIADGSFKKIFDEEVQRLLSKEEFKIGRLDSLLTGGKSHTINPVFNSIDEMSIEQSNRLSQTAIKETLRRLKSDESSQDYAFLQEYLNDLGMHPDIYIQVGFGPPEISQGYENSTKFRKVRIINLDINQDSGRDQIVTVVLGPDKGVTEKVSSFGAPFQTASEKGSISYYPDKLEGELMPFTLLEGVFSNNPSYQPLDKVKLPLKELKQDNSPILISMIESLLHSYLATSECIPLVFLAPQLDAKIREQVDPNGDGFLKPEVVSRLAKDLRECFIEVVVKQNVMEATVVEDDVGDGAARVIKTPQGDIAPNETILRAGKVYFRWDLKLRTNEEYSKLENVKAIIAALYKKFGVQPSDITHTFVTSLDHKKIIIKKLFEYVSKKEKVANERQKRTNRRRGTNLGETVENKFFVNQYASESSRTSVNTYTEGQFDDPLQKYFRSDYWKDPQKYLGIKSVRNTEVAKIEEEDYNEGNIPDLLLVGDDFFIRSIVYPNDPDFSQSSYDRYIETLYEATKSLKSKMYCNAFKFIAKLGKDSYSYLDYIKDFNDKIYKTSIGVKASGMVPDEFAMFITDVEQNILKTIPTFIANKENSNVISVTSKENGFAFSEFSKFFTMTQSNGIRSLAEAFRPVRKDSDYVFNLSEDQIEEMASRVMRLTFNNISMIRAIETLTESEDAMSEDNDEIARLKEYYKSFIYEIKNSPLVSNKKLSVDDVVNYITYMDTLAKQTRSIVIKVPPQFYISSLEILRLPVMFFHENPFITTATSPLSRRSLLSGLYEVIGYKHTVTSSDCYTELVLQRNPLSDAYNITAMGVQL